jgi:hypothetical protein
MRRKLLSVGEFPNVTIQKVLLTDMPQPARKKTQNAAAKRSPKLGAVGSTSKQQAAAKLASMLEEHMRDLGLSDEEKNLRVTRFSDRVDSAIERHAKS